MSSISVAGDTSGSISITAPLVAGSGVLTLPVATDTLVGKATTDTLTNKSIAVTQLTGTLPVANGGTGVTTSTGSGANVLGTSPTLVTPALGTPASGVLTNCTGVARAALPAGCVLQVVSTTKTDTFSTTSTSPVDVTGLSVSITPSSATSKIFVTGSVCYGTSTADYLMGFLLVRNSTSICIADAAGSRSRWTFGSQGFTSLDTSAFSPINFLDSPATTSATTYKIQAQAESPRTLWINRGAESDGDVAVTGRFTSTITVMEIAV